MNRRRVLAWGLVLLTGAALGSLVFIGLPRWFPPPARPAAAAPSATAPSGDVRQQLTPGRKIKAHLYYVAEDGMGLTSAERDVSFGEGPLEQARQIVIAQIAPVVEPTMSAIPQGTTLRALFLGDKGEAFVDLSKEAVSAHPGGTLNELLTVYTIVNVLTTNLPAVTSVQVLVDGKEVETLAGHVDLRRPLARNLDYVEGQ
ncbi:MAG TPA: GerMN domain-containing protein [Vicinamibacterales bacterium]